jgi:putative DNA primase/helicase
MMVRSMAAALGGQLAGQNRILAPGPGHSAADRSMSILVDQEAPDGFVVTSFAGDDWRVCREHVLGRLGKYPNISPVPEKSVPRSSNSPDKTAIAAAIWREAAPLSGTVGQAHLQHRGLVPAPEWFTGEPLRFHARCPFKLETGATIKLPAMVAAMVDIRTNAFRGIHRTALAADGDGKATIAGLGNAKKMLGPAAGACVKLSPDEDVSLGLHLAEGIETALACIGMGFRPVWAALSAGGMANFPVLAGIECLTVFADHDEAGCRAAVLCCERWAQAGIEARYILPHEHHTDFADRWHP